MATLDPLALLFDIIRIVIAFGFVIFLVIMFFSFRVEVKEDSMKRFVFELSDSLSQSQLTSEKSIYDSAKLTDAQRNGGEPVSACDFGYYFELESIAGKRCSADSECNGGECVRGSCRHEFSFGYNPGASTIATASEEFPAGIRAGDAVIPAKIKLTAYDTLLTRISCMAQKAFELRDTFEMKFAKSMIYDAPQPVFERKQGGTHACIYSRTPSGEVAVDCRALPANVVFDRFEFSGLPAGAGEGTIVAYPVKRPADCGEIKTNPKSEPSKDIVYQKGDSEQIEKIILCMEAKR